MKDIIDVDYVHIERVCRGFKIINLGDYHDLYVQSNTLLSADIFENVRSMCLKIYELDPCHFVFAPESAW